MSLLNDINSLLDERKETKAQKLLKIKDEIILMIEKKIPLQTQIDLIVKNGIVDKIALSEYKKILLANFEYLPKTQKKNPQPQTQIEPSTHEPKPKQNPQPIKINPARSAKDILSQQIDLA